MALVTVATGNTILATHINQFVTVLQRTSGTTEAGAYAIAFGAYAINAAGSCWISSLSRGVTPASVAIDTANQAVHSLNAPTASLLNANGFLVTGTATAINTNAGCAGNYTITY